MNSIELDFVNSQRKQSGFMTISDVMELQKKNNVILDVFSLLISVDVKIESNNIFYPNVIIQRENSGSIEIGSSNIFYHNTFILASKGSVSIGNNNIFGDGGFSIKANMPNANIIIENNGRYMNGTQIMGSTYLGSGTQILGNITVQDCHLEGGLSFEEKPVNARGSVLKGFGFARKISLKKGEVINGNGIFKEEEILNQSFFHK